MAVTVAVWLVAIETAADAVNVADIDAAGMVTVAGTVRLALLLLSETAIGLMEV